MAAGKAGMFTTIREKLMKNWFICGVIIVIFLAHSNPDIGAKGGPMMPEITIKYIAVTVIFFNSGLSLKTEELTKALMAVKVHLFIQGFTLGFIPCFMWGIIKFLSASPINPHLLQGLQVLACLPPPVSSAVIFTKTVGGNEAAAIFNSAFGSFLGIVASPALILIFIGSTGSVPFSDIFGSLFMTVVLPIFVGQIVRRYIREWLDRVKPPFGIIGSYILLTIIYCTFCDTFGNANLNIDKFSLLAVAVVVFAVQATLITTVFILTTRLRFLGFHPQDTACAMFCAVHKSLTLGIPMIKIVFQGNEYLSFLTIPMLIYHPTQMLVSGLIVPNVKTWMNRAMRNEGPLLT